MGPRRGRLSKLALVCALSAPALLAAGCGVQEHANEARPQPPTRVSVVVNEDQVTVQPPRIAFGPEPQQQIPQNQHTSQPQVRSNAPLSVTFVAANLTEHESRLEVRGQRNLSSKRLVASGNISLQAGLPTGVYTVSAADVPSAKPAKLVVGPYRSSSENDVLLP